jgi:hypothetical protein
MNSVRNRANATAFQFWQQWLLKGSLALLFLYIPGFYRPTWAEEPTRDFLFHYLPSPGVALLATEAQLVENYLATQLGQAHLSYYNNQSLAQLRREDLQLLSAGFANPRLNAQQIQMINAQFQVSSYIRYSFIHNEGQRYQFMFNVYDLASGELIFSLPPQFLLLTEQAGGKGAAIEKMLAQAFSGSQGQWIQRLKSQENSTTFLHFHGLSQRLLPKIYALLKHHSHTVKVLHLSEAEMQFALEPKSSEDLHSLLEALEDTEELPAFEINTRGKRYDLYF